MKPNTSDAMHNLIKQIRESIPFDAPEADICSDSCQFCAKKLLFFLDSLLIEQEDRLNSGEIPNFADLHKLAKISKKIYKALIKGGHIKKTFSNRHLS